MLLSLAAFMVKSSTFKPSKPTSNNLRAVAGENFWGSILSQIGGSKVEVTSVITDPNVDPHEYTSDSTNARAFSEANYVVLNGAGYDSWGDKLLSASPSSSRKVLNVSDFLHKSVGDNPHFWYGPDYVNAVSLKIEQDLSALQPNNAAYFKQHYTILMYNLSQYQKVVASIKSRYGGTKIASTESIAVYLADAAGLNIVSPPEFMQAISEGNDPPANSIVTFQQQLASGSVKLLIYNRQTSTPLTQSMIKLASSHNIPIVGVSETVHPLNESFQNWMNVEMQAINTALKGSGQ